jgi:hypothetical protein
MMASSSSEKKMYASAWVLDPGFDVAEHQQLANPDTKHFLCTRKFSW